MAKVFECERDGARSSPAGTRRAVGGLIQDDDGLENHPQPASLYASPEEARRPPLRSSCTSPACTEGPASSGRTSSQWSTPIPVRLLRGDRPRDADAEHRRRAPSLRLEPLQLGLPRARPLAPDRSGVPLVADPRPRRRRRSAEASNREGDRAGGARREDGLHASPHRPLHAWRQRRRQHARRSARAAAPAASRSSTRGPSR